MTALAQRIEFADPALTGAAQGSVFVSQAKAEANSVPSFWRSFVLSRITERLESLRHLSTGWDGGNARSIDDTIVESSLEWLMRLISEGVPTPSVVPTVDGGVQFEWHTQRYHVEISVDQPADFFLFIMDRDTGAVSEYSASSNLPDARAALSAALTEG
jgi:hypothetical protein